MKQKLNGFFKFWNTWVDHNPGFLFLTLSLLVYWLIGIFDHFTGAPHSVHFIRQTDSLSFFMGYYQYGNSFFEPRVYEITGMAGKAAAEFPLLYWLSAQIAHITGPSFLILRSLNFLIFSLGIFCLFRIAYGLLQRFIPAFVCTWLSLSAIVVFYYALSWVPDPPALGFAMIFWYFIYRNTVSSSIWNWICAGLFISLAGLIKPTTLIYALSLFAGVVLFQSKKRRSGNWERRQWIWSAFLLNVVAFSATIAWVVYARNYNETHGNLYFLADSRPIWDMTGEQIAATWEMISAYWFPSFFHVDLFWFWTGLLVLAFIGLFFFRSIWTGMFLPVFLGCSAILLLFFRQFHDHDYYAIVLYLLLFFLLLSVLLQVKHHYYKAFKHPLFAIILIVPLYMALKHTDRGLDHRFAMHDEFASAYRQLQGYDQVLDSLKIPDTAHVGIVGGMTPNAALLAIKRPGYIVRDTSSGELGRLIGMHDQRRLDYVLLLKHMNLSDSFQQVHHLDPVFNRDSVKCYRIAP